MKLSITIIFLIILSSVIVNAQQNIKGETTIGTTAVTETVRDIMARQISGVNPRSVEREKEKQYPNRNNLPQNPNSPEASTYSATMNIINGPNQVTSSAPITKGLSFTGATLTGGGAFPPDNMGAVGPTQYVVAINSIIISYNKTTGVADGVLNITTDNFFASVMSTNSGTFTSDPHIRYDRLSKKWIFVIIDVPAGTGAIANRILIGVISDSVITASTPIKYFYYQNSGNFIDYPTLGIDKNAIYIGCNIFNLAGTAFLGSTALVVQKSSIMASGPMTSTYFTLGGASSGIYTPQGVDNLYDLTATEGYFIGVDAGLYGILDLVRVNNPGSASPTITIAPTITVASTYGPGTFYAKPGSASYNLDPDDDRLFAAMIRNGHLWTAHHIETTNAGVGSGSGTRISARWYDLINFKTGSTPSLNQSGTVYSSALTSTRDKNYGYPTITVNGQGHALMGFTIAGYYSYANAGYTYRLSSDPANSMNVPDSNTTSSTSYNPADGTPHRWGDYSMTEVDPSDDMTFWTIQQYCNGTNNYGCRVSQFKSPGPATLLSATPNVLNSGTNLTLVLKGDTTTGLGFYEPGSGFSKHLTAAIDGGITVNSITYTSAGTVVLNVTTTGGTSGARTITITNPDGQVVSSGSIFTYTPATPTLVAAPTSLTGFSYTAGAGPSASQSYNLSGTNLTGAPGIITITGSTDYQVSNNNSTWGSSTTIAYSSATLTSTPVYIRLKSGLTAGSYNLENVSNAGGGATTINVPCSGTVNPAPALVAAPTSLTGFFYTAGSGPSTSQSYNLSGTNLTGAPGIITITGSTDYQVSNNNSTWGSSTTIAYSSATLTSTPVYVRLKSGLTAGNYNLENVSNAGGGATTINVPCSGTVNPAPALVAAPTSLTGYSYTAGSGPSASQSYNLSGTNLTGAPGNITVTGSTDYEVSNNNSTWGSSATVAYSSATLSSTPVYVRLKSGLIAGNYNLENISNAGGGATTLNVPCSGTVNPIPTLTLTSLIEGLYNSGTMTPDTIKVTLRDASMAFVDSSSAVLNSSGVGIFTFANAVNGTQYWLDITHRNAIETYSSTTQSFTSGLLSFDFTTSQSQAYGSNLVSKAAKWCIYSGDVNQDGIIDSGDMGIIDNDNATYVSGYTNTDVNGDGIVDSGDLGLVDNNNAIYVGKIVPVGAPYAIKVNRPVIIHNQNK
jgi:hypothetical protein